MVRVSREQFTDFSHLVNILEKEFVSMSNDTQRVAYDTQWSNMIPAYAIVSIQSPAGSLESYNISLEYLEWLGYKFTDDGVNIIPIEGDGVEIDFDEQGLPKPKDNN